MTSKIKKIYLMMGLACNFQCKYCLQNPIKENIQERKISSELYEYIDYLIDAKEKDNIKIQIVFWGGEPLLYWNIIKEFVEHYQYKLKYGIISNGSLLSKDIVDFLEKYRIGFTLSHDGPNTIYTRNIDVLKNKNILELCNKIYPLLNAVISGKNFNYNKIFDYFDNNYPEFPIHIEMLRITWDMPDDLKNVDLNDYRIGLKDFFLDSVNIIKKEKCTHKSDAATSIINRILKTNKNHRYHFPKCNQVERVLNIDLDGNLYVCHNSNIKIGHVKDARKDYLNRYWKWLETRKKPECDTCEIRYYCQGGCPLDISNEACNLQKILYEEAMKSYEQNKEIWDKEINK